MFDKNLAGVSNNIAELKYEAETQNTATKDQLKMLKGINERMDNTEKKMVKIDARLEKYVDAKSDCKVWIYISI